MANNGLRRRERLFEFFSKHFALGDSEKREVFVCPLCLRIFTQEAWTPRLHALLATMTLGRGSKLHSSNAGQLTILKLESEQ